MRNRQRQRKPGKEQMVSYHNHERYSDPTAFLAIRNIVKEERRKPKHN